MITIGENKQKIIPAVTPEQIPEVLEQTNDSPQTNKQTNKPSMPKTQNIPKKELPRYNKVDYKTKPSPLHKTNNTDDDSDTIDKISHPDKQEIISSEIYDKEEKLKFKDSSPNPIEDKHVVGLADSSLEKSQNKRLQENTSDTVESVPNPPDLPPKENMTNTKNTSSSNPDSIAQNISANIEQNIVVNKNETKDMTHIHQNKITSPSHREDKEASSKIRQKSVSTDKENSTNAPTIVPREPDIMTNPYDLPSAPETTVTINIGRIDIRAPGKNTVVQKPKEKFIPSLSLTEYLKQKGNAK